MKITIEISAGELKELLTQQEDPEITDEIHEDFAEDPQEPEPKPDIEPVTEPENDPELGNDPEPEPASESPKPTRTGRKTRPVDVRINGEWFTFPSSAEAAKNIGCLPSQMSSSASHGWKCKGFEVRFTPDEKDEEILPR